MGSNISGKDLRIWMLKNNWEYKGKTKHEQWVYEIEEIKISAPLTINFNVKKGLGIHEYTLKQIAEIMKISKEELVDSIRRNKKYSLEELCSFYQQNFLREYSEI